LILKYLEKYQPNKHSNSSFTDAKIKTLETEISHLKEANENLMAHLKE